MKAFEFVIESISRCSVLERLTCDLCGVALLDSACQSTQIPSLMAVPWELNVTRGQIEYANLDTYLGAVDSLCTRVKRAVLWLCQVTEETFPAVLASGVLLTATVADQTASFSLQLGEEGKMLQFDICMHFLSLRMRHNLQRLCF